MPRYERTCTTLDATLGKLVERFDVHCDESNVTDSGLSVCQRYIWSGECLLMLQVDGDRYLACGMVSYSKYALWGTLRTG